MIGFRVQGLIQGDSRSLNDSFNLLIHLPDFVSCEVRGLKVFSGNRSLYGGFQKKGYLSGGPYKKDHSVWGSILGSLILGNYHFASPYTGPDKPNPTFNTSRWYG